LHFVKNWEFTVKIQVSMTEHDLERALTDAIRQSLKIYCDLGLDKKQPIALKYESFEDEEKEYCDVMEKQVASRKEALSERIRRLPPEK
jgi:hypothetical protein